MPLPGTAGHLQRLVGPYPPTRRQCGYLIIRKLAFHGKELAIISQQLPTPVHQVGEGGKGPAADLAERLVGVAGLGAAMDDLDVGESQFQHALGEEAGFLAVAVKQGKAGAGQCDRQRNTGQTTTGADIQQVTSGHPGQDTQAVEQLA